MKYPLLLASDNEIILGYIVLWIIAFIISVYITRWIFGIPTIIQHLKLQTANLKIMRKVLNELAEKQGLTKEDILKIEEESVSETYH